MPIPKKVRSSAKAPTAVLAAAALLLLCGCGQDPLSAPGSTGADTTGTVTTGAAPAAPSNPDTATDEYMTDLLQLNARLKTDLGSAYSDAWIENNQLHVAVTSPEAEAAVTDAGAIPYRARFSADQLKDAVDAFKAWLGTDPAPRVQLHWLGTSGRTGSITVRVPADQVQPLTDALAAQRPTGAVKVIVEESSGPATPLATNGP